MNKLRNTKESSVRMSPRYDTDILKFLDEVQLDIRASKTYTFKFLLRLGYEKWKKDKKRIDKGNQLV